jgi:hypothetical protein
VLISCVASPPAVAQDFEITEEQLRRFAAILELSAEQEDILRTLHGGTQSAIQAIADSRHDRSVALQDQVKNAADATTRIAAQKEHFALSAEWRKERDQCITEFFDDLQVLLTKAQLAHVPALQRQRLRDVYLTDSYLPGARIYLLDLVSQLKLEEGSDLRDASQAYELDLDRLLNRRRSLHSEMSKLLLSGDTLDDQGHTRQLFDDPMGLKLVRDQLEIDKEFLHLNERYVRVLSALLPNDDQQQFIDLFNDALLEGYVPTHSEITELFRFVTTRGADLPLQRPAAVRQLQEKYVALDRESGMDQARRGIARTTAKAFARAGLGSVADAEKAIKDASDGTAERTELFASAIRDLKSALTAKETEDLGLTTLFESSSSRDQISIWRRIRKGEPDPDDGL